VQDEVEREETSEAELGDDGQRGVDEAGFEVFINGDAGDRAAIAVGAPFARRRPLAGERDCGAALACNGKD
jgi:hypothetical protein